jgi:hypothetical protein
MSRPGGTFSFPEHNFNRPAPLLILSYSGAEPDDGVLWAWSGAAAPVGGKWLLEAHGTYTQMRKKGQRMPFSQRESVRWILAHPDAAEDAGS